VSPSTGRPASGAAPRRAWGSLTRAQIVAAGLRIAREEGMQALTIRRVAADAGASRMALYRHVADKDALVDLVMDAIAEHEIIPPGREDGPWPERLRLLATGIRRELATYPGLAEIMATRVHHGPGALRTVEATLRILTDAGLNERQAALYYMIFLDLVLGRIHREAHDDAAAHHRAASLNAPGRQAHDLTRLHATAPHLTEITDDHIFNTELDMLVQAITTAAEHDQ